MRHSYFLTLPLFLLAAARPKRRSDDAQVVLLKAGTGVTLSNKDATLSLTPGQTTTLPFDGSTYTSEVFWATASGSKTEIVSSRLKAGGSAELISVHNQHPQLQAGQSVRHHHPVSAVRDCRLGFPCAENGHGDMYGSAHGFGVPCRTGAGDGVPPCTW